MKLFVYNGRFREVVEVPEKKADGKPLSRSVKGALHLAAGTVNLTDDEAEYLASRCPDTWARISVHEVPERKPDVKPPVAKSEPKAKIAEAGGPTEATRTIRKPRGSGPRG